MSQASTYRELQIDLLPDSIEKVDLLNKSAWELRRIDTKKAFALSQQAHATANSINYQKGIVESLRTIGFCHWYFSNLVTALEHSMDAMKLFKELYDKKGETQAMNTVAKIYTALGDFDKALQYFQTCIQLSQQIRDPEEEAISLSNLGDMYMKLGKYETALSFFMKSFAKKEGVSQFTRGLVTYNIGEVHYHLKNDEESLNYLTQSLQICEAVGYKLIVTANLCVLGKVFLRQHQLDDAISYLEKAVDVAESIDSKLDIYQAKEALSLVYEKKGDFATAFEHYKRFHKEREEMFNHNNLQRIKNIQFLHDTISIKQETEIERLKNIELQKAYDEIEKQQHLIIEKNKNITDSIKYAKRIQEAIFPPDKFIKELFTDLFIYYTSKDIVCGDFYWAYKDVSDKFGENILFAAVDCTGHGVPGAFMSLVGHSLLNTAVKEKDLVEPAAILDFLNKGVTKTLRQTYEQSTVRDGMDIALCSWNKEKQLLQFAGANNPLWLIRNGELIEIKGDKFPVGIFLEEKMQNFTNHQLNVCEGDVIYIFSDGYADQFGGKKGKKFTKKRLKEKLLSIHHLPMSHQLSELQNTMMSWQGYLEQVDDMLIMGIRI